MKKFLSILAVCAIAVGLAVVASSTDRKTHQYRCQGQNEALYFVIYEVDGEINKGHMYFNNTQVAVLEPYRMNRATIRAKVAGNTADVELGFNKSRKLVFVTNNKTGSVKDLCECTYGYR